MITDWRFFLWIIWDDQKDNEPFRFFRDQYDARKWIEDEHKRLWDTENDRFLTETREGYQYSRGFEVAILLEILPSGEAHQIDAYSTVAGKDNRALGWDSNNNGV